MHQQLKVLEVVIQILDMNNIAYMLTGSLAMGLYAEPRMTRDIDIVVSIQNISPIQFSILFKEIFYVDDIAIQLALEHEKMFNMIHHEFGVKIDFIILKDNLFEQNKFHNKQKIKINGFTCNVISKDDLIIQKLYWSKSSFSEFQLRDIRNLLKSGYDKAYLYEWIETLGLHSIWKEAIQ